MEIDIDLESMQSNGKSVNSYSVRYGVRVVLDVFLKVLLEKFRFSTASNI